MAFLSNLTFPAFALTAITCDDGGSTTPNTWDVGTRTAAIKLDEREILACTFANTNQFILTSDCTEYYLKDTVTLTGLAALGIVVVRRR